MTRKTSIPTKHWRWPPPKVLKNTALYASVIYFLATTPAIGNPLPIPLAIVIISGLKPAHLCPQNFYPTLPKPVCTSSAIIRPPYFLTILAIPGPYPCGTGLIPPTPWIGSKIIPAILP